MDNKIYTESSFTQLWFCMYNGKGSKYVHFGGGREDAILIIVTG
jgi:hypothetical protein